MSSDKIVMAPERNWAWTDRDLRRERQAVPDGAQVRARRIALAKRLKSRLG